MNIYIYIYMIKKKKKEVWILAIWGWGGGEGSSKYQRNTIIEKLGKEEHNNHPPRDDMTINL